MRNLFSKRSGVGASVLASGLAVLIAMPSAVRADPSDWANAVIREMKQAERAVSEPGVRVASLGDSAFEVAPRKAKRNADVEVPVASSNSDDAPKAKAKPKKVASLGNVNTEAKPERAPRKSLSGGSVDWVASSGCLDGTLRSIINSIASNYGPVRVNSTCRSKSRNAAVGGAEKSYHLKGEAADFRIGSNVSAVYAYLRGNGNVGGLKHYGGGLFHIDTGPRRSW